LNEREIDTSTRGESRDAEKKGIGHRKKAIRERGKKLNGAASVEDGPVGAFWTHKSRNGRIEKGSGG